VTIATNTPTFTWEPLGVLGVAYEIQVDDVPTFDTDDLVLNTTTFLETYTVSDTQPLADGTYYWRVRGFTAGPVNGPFSVTRIFTIDTTSGAPTPTPTPSPTPSPTATSQPSGPQPVITILSPENQDVFNSSPITVSGTVTRPSQVAMVTVNGFLAAVNGTDWVASVPVAEGVNVVEAIVKSTDNSVDNDVVNITVDTFAPQVAITNPDGQVTTGSVITVFGNVQDATVGTVDSTNVQVVVNGAPAQVSNRTFTVPNIPLAEGLNTITAVATDEAGNSSQMSIKVTRNTSLAESISLVSGDNQSAESGQMLADPLLVRMLRSDGTPIANREIVFRVVEGDGVVNTADRPAQVRAVAVMTDASGFASADFNLGSRAGSGIHKVRASSVGVATQVLFSASALPKGPYKVAVAGGNNQRGEVNAKLKFPLVAVVTDENHNPVEGVDLTFRVTQGSGMFDGQATEVIVQSDEDGRAIVQFTLGNRAGFDVHRVEVTFPGQQTLPAIFVASGFRASTNDENTLLSGLVLDNSNQPIEGVTISIDGFTDEALTNAQGQFTLSFAGPQYPVGHEHLHIDGTTATSALYPVLAFEIDIIRGVDNLLSSPVYLVPLDPAHAQLVSSIQGALFTLENVPGFSMTVKPGSAIFGDGSDSGFVSITQVHGDKVPMVPPNGMQWRFVITIQPANVVFNPPAPFTLPNLEGLPPGAKAELFSFDHDLGSFVSVGTGTVSEDGSVIASDPGFGIIKGGWHGGGNPPPPGGAGGGGGGY
jgi:hypothetical protein